MKIKKENNDDNDYEKIQNDKMKEKIRMIKDECKCEYCNENM